MSAGTRSFIPARNRLMLDLSAMCWRYPRLSVHN